MALFVLRTTAACILAIVVSVVVAAIAGKFIYFTQRFITEIRPEIIGFIAGVFGAVMGIYAARSACDSIIKDYSPRIVAVMFVCVMIMGFLIEFFIIPVAWSQIAAYAQFATIGIAGIVNFWNRPQTRFSN